MAGINKLAQKCAKCGSCAQVCPVFLETGRESHCARGKLHLFTKNINPSSTYFNSLLSKCIQCKACDDTCPRNLEPSLIIRQMRCTQTAGQAPKGYSTYLTRQILYQPTLLATAGFSLSLLQKLPAASGLRQKINTISPHENEHIPQAKTAPNKSLLYYPGCLAHHFQTDIGLATNYLANLCDYTLTIPNKVTCCGIASSTSGKEQEARQQALRNIKAYSINKEPILTSCGSCYAQLKSYPNLFTKGSANYNAAVTFAKRLQEFSTFFCTENKLASHSEPQTVYYHDPCHLRFGENKIINAPRQLIGNLNDKGIVNGDKSLGCCGQGGLFTLANPSLAKAIFNRARNKATPHGQAIVVTTCSSCLLGWQQGTQDTPITAQHLSVFLAKICRNC